MPDDGETVILYWSGHNDIRGRPYSRPGGSITVSAAFARWGVHQRLIRRIPLSINYSHFLLMLACGVDLTRAYETYLAEVLPHVR